MRHLPDAIQSYLQTPVTLAKLELRVLELPQVKPFVSAIGVRNSRKALIVCWHMQNGVVGYGECSCRPDPFYSHEFVNGAQEIIEKFIVPQLEASTTYGAVVTVLKKIRGWNFTKAAVEFAMNDALRRSTGSGILEAWSRPKLEKVPVGISLGLFASSTQMSTAIEEAIAEGYKRLKFKINPAYAQPDILALLKECRHPMLSFDANGSFSKMDLKSLHQFAALGYMIEQPFAPGYAFLQKKFKNQYGKAIFCLDEEIESLGSLITQKNNLDELNIKPGRVGGLLQTIEMMEYCFSKNIPVWIGGMFETGIGRAQNLQIASFIPKATAHDQSPSHRYFTKDVLQKNIAMNDGYISAMEFEQVEINLPVFEQLTVNKKILTISNL